MPSLAPLSAVADAPALYGPAVWRANELAGGAGQTVPTGHAALDAALPGGGWPVGALIELLQAQPGQGEWRLLLPALIGGRVGGLAGGLTDGVGHGVADGAIAAGARVLVGAPHLPFLPGLAAQGLPAACLLQVQADAPAARVWACEQALRCAGVSAVLAWLPQVRPEQLRRLQMVAQAHRKLLFVMRPLAAQHEASPAVLRLQVQEQEQGQGQEQGQMPGPPDDDALVLHILKRRGPPLQAPLRLPARPARLQALLAASRHQAGRRRAVADGVVTRPSAPATLVCATTATVAIPATASVRAFTACVSGGAPAPVDVGASASRPVAARPVAV